MSSDSSDEENLEFLKEAQDSQFINDSMFSEDPEKLAKHNSDNQTEEVLPSLRTVKDKDEQFNFLKVTPEFRNYVGKRLSQILDEQLKELLVDIEADETHRRKRKKGGVKLLSDSKHYLKLSKNQVLDDSYSEGKSHLKKVTRYGKLSVKVPEGLLREVAVSPEDILSKKEVQSWSNRSKAPVFQYKKTSNGKLVLVEPEFK